MKLKHWPKLGLGEWILIGSIVIAFGLFLVLGIIGGFAGSNGAWPFLVYYGHSIGSFLVRFFVGAIGLLCLAVVAFVTWGLLKNFLGLFIPKMRKWTQKESNGSPLDVFLVTMRQVKKVVLILPALFFILLISLSLGEANEIDKTRLKDLMVIGWEHALTGHYIFAALGSIQYPHWLIEVIIRSFDFMSAAIIVGAIIVALFDEKILREMIVAFCIGTLISVPIWIAIPVLSPHDRFIDNVYKLPVPPNIAAVVAGYHPQQEIADFLVGIRNSKQDLPALPTSTIPSAHIFWAVITGYYLFRAKKWIGWVTLPFLAASSFGTILLAQHYFTDVPAGMAVGVISIWLAYKIEKKQGKMEAAAARAAR